MYYSDGAWFSYGCGSYGGLSLSLGECCVYCSDQYGRKYDHRIYGNV
jgi:hypothetical protein